MLTKIRARQHQLGLLKWGADYLDPHNDAAILPQGVSVTALRRGVSGLVLGALSDRTRHEGVVPRGRR